MTCHCVCISLQQDLCTFLISRACKNSELANYLYWWVAVQSILVYYYWKCPCVYIHLSKTCVFLRYVIVECEDQDTQQRDPKTHEMYLNVMRRFSQALLKVSHSGIKHCVCMGSAANWTTTHTTYIFPCAFPFNTNTSSSLQGDKSVRVMRSLLAAQQTFVDRLVQLMKAVQRESGNRKKKVTTEYPHMQILAKPIQYFLSEFKLCSIHLYLL